MTELNAAQIQSLRNRDLVRQARVILAKFGKPEEKMKYSKYLKATKER